MRDGRWFERPVLNVVRHRMSSPFGVTSCAASRQHENTIRSVCEQLMRDAQSTALPAISASRRHWRGDSASRSMSCWLKQRPDVSQKRRNSNGGRGAIVSAVEQYPVSRFTWRTVITSSLVTSRNDNKRLRESGHRSSSWGYDPTFLVSRYDIPALIL